MSHPLHLAAPSTASPLLWQADCYPANPPARRGLSVWRATVLCLGPALTVGAGAVAWADFSPATLVQTRIVADQAGPGSRAVLAEAALRLATTPGQPVSLERNGDALVIAVSAGDPLAARQQARSFADMLLNLPIAGAAEHTVWVSPLPEKLPPEPNSKTRAAVLIADQNRLQAALEAADSRIATTSASLTGIVRDMAMAARASADRKPGHEVLDKSSAALADLQLQRIQLQSRYQDDYPAVVALDGQIRALRSFLLDESRRAESAAHTGADAGDPILIGERDRLRAELSRSTDRRAGIAAELATVGRTLATLPVDPSEPRPNPVSPSPAPAAPPPVLVQAATVETMAPDIRWFAVPAAALAGLLLSVIAWFKPGHRYYPVASEALLQRLESALHSRANTALPANGISVLPQAETPLLLWPQALEIELGG